MKIGEFARSCGVASSTIRFYETQGILPPPPRGVNGYREYGAPAIEALRLIQQAQKLGFSLNEIRSAAPAGGLDTLNCERILELLRLKRDAIQAQLDALALQADAVEASIREFEQRRLHRPQNAAS